MNKLVQRLAVEEMLNRYVSGVLERHWIMTGEQLSWSEWLEKRKADGQVE